MATSITGAANTARKNAAVKAVSDLLDAGAGPGTVEIRTGAQPANADAAATGTLLAVLTLSDPAFGAPSAGVVTANSITGDSSANASGTAGWFRAKDSNGNAVIDGNITATGGGGDLELDDVNIVAGGTVNITAWTITQP